MPCSSKDLGGFVKEYKKGMGLGGDDEDKEEESPNKQVIINKEIDVKLTLQKIDQGLAKMETAKSQNIELINKEFDDLVKKLQIRRDTLIKQMNEITNDKKEILTKQMDQLKLFQNELNEEKDKDAEDIDVTITEQDVSIKTKPEIILNINNDKLSKV